MQLDRLATGFDRDQCDHIGQFLKVLANKFSFKSSPNILQILGAILKYVAFFLKMLFIIFRQLFENLGYFKLRHLVTLIGRLDRF